MTADQLLLSVTAESEALSLDDARDLMQSLLAGEFSPQEMTDLLTALHERGETAAELAGFAQAMREASITLPLTDAERDTLVDTCGTGGDASGTFNISTATALVAAAAGARVAKHGNRSITSRCGSADVLEALGIPIEHTPESAAEAIRRHGFAFLLATRMHPAMRIVAPVRRALPFRTVFNLLGPMTNPAGARRQVLGVYSAQAVPLVAEALATSAHMHSAMVVHGEGATGGLDELALSGPSTVATVHGPEVHVQTLRPEDAGLTPSTDFLQGGDARENAAILLEIFAAGSPGSASSPRRDIVLLNAAAVLQIAGIADSLVHGRELAAHAIDSGAVTRLINALRG
ncbi:anthranilate phosphoribosyltransferase [Terriglobus aquaticus]|uniref:Anthranilate phosphoribosyltransferase n=1 Tax=Terriglobus aquaticus TaxID=940139 RepID=A0ABW9KH09_9BACT|nr:anthranilate phosphoribosyltransferase [Terriglobus aquaticus]